MPIINKPQNINKVWSSSGDRATPTDQKISQGWVPEIPPHQWFNYIDHKQDQAIAHMNQFGIVQWDAVTEYQAGRSYVQGPTNGTVYRAIQTHTNQNPEVTQGYWEIAFLSEAPNYNGVYARLDQNLNDIPNKNQARSNLGVYSQAQVDQIVNQAVQQATASAIGIGQTWRNLTSSRNIGSTYTNNTSKPIMVMVTGNLNSYTVTIGGTTISGHDGDGYSNISFIVPPQTTYRVNGSARELQGWAELR